LSYNDIFENKIKGKFINCNIYIYGNNNSLSLSNNSYIKDSTIILRNNNEINIGSNSFIQDCKIDLFDNSKLTVGSNARLNTYQGLKTCFIYMLPASTLEIGSFVTFWYGYQIHLSAKHKIIIKDDCMFSCNVSLLSGEGHPIFNSQSKKLLNRTRNIDIGEHVWVGENVFIKSPCLIKSGSLIACNSLAVGNFPNNCILGGSPASVIKENITWDRNNYIEPNDKYCNITTYDDFKI